MANEDKKDFNAMLNNSKDMPKIKELDKEEVIKRYGGKRMLLAPPLDYDAVMKQVPQGKVITSNEIRNYLSHKYQADFTCPLTAGIFISIVAWAAHQRQQDITPYWRTLKAEGELNEKYPGGIEAQKAKLEAEGHHIVSKGKTTLHYFVENFENDLFKLA